MRRGEVDLVNDCVVNDDTTCFPLNMFLPLKSILQLPFSSLSSHVSLYIFTFLSSSCFSSQTMATGKPLPKFGEWDVNNPASAEGFTVIFSKASDEKKTKKASGGAGPSTLVSPQNTDQNNLNDSQNPKAKKKWFCFG